MPLRTDYAAGDAFGAADVNEITSLVNSLASASSVTLTDTQSLSNKTLVSPSLTGTTSVASGGEIRVFNTADQTTNFERGRLYFNANTLTLQSDSGGTGTITRSVNIQTPSGMLIVARNNNATFGVVQANVPTNAAGAAQFGVVGTLSASSGSQAGAYISSTINQSGTAGYTGLLINPTETATGSGTKRLIDAQVGGSSRFTVDNAGLVNAVGGVQVNGVDVVTLSGTQTLTNKTLTIARTDVFLGPGGGVSFRTLSTGGSDVNYATVRATPAGTAPVIAVTGSDTNVSMNLTTKGTGTVQANGVPILTRSIQTVTSTVTLGGNANTDYVVFIGASGSVTLPTAVGNTSRYTIKNIDTVSRTVTAAAGQTIDGSAVVWLTPDTSLDLISDGSNWRII